MVLNWRCSYILCIFAILLQIACIDNYKESPKGFVVEAKLNIPQKTKGILLSLTKDKTYEVDSFDIDNGEFKFFKEVKPDEDSKVYTINIPKLDYNLNFFGEIGDTVKINSTHKSLQDIQISNSDINKNIVHYFSIFDTILHKIDSLQQKIYTLQKSNRIKTKLLDTLQIQLRNLNRQYYIIDSSYIMANISQKIIPFILFNRYSNLGNSLDGIMPFMASLPKESKSHFYVRMINQIEKNKLNIGNQFRPNTELYNTAGDIVSFDDVELGKYTLIDFWASWCAPCRENSIGLKKLYNRYHSKGFEIIGLSLDTEKENWLEAIEKDKLYWKNYTDLRGWKSNIVVDKLITFIPYNILIDDNYNIVKVNLSTEEINVFLKGHL